MSAHYHAGYNVSGFLPETDPSTHSSYVEAATAMAEEMLYSVRYGTFDAQEADDMEHAAAEVKKVSRARMEEGIHYFAPDGYTYWVEVCSDPECAPVRAFRVHIEATVEADSPAEAQVIAANLLAGLDPHNDYILPLTGPGSWAPDVKIIQEV